MYKRQWYAHLQGFRTKLGKRVVRGEVIGAVGSTGKRDVYKRQADIKVLPGDELIDALETCYDRDGLDETIVLCLSLIHI